MEVPYEKREREKKVYWKHNGWKLTKHGMRNTSRFMRPKESQIAWACNGYRKSHCEEIVCGQRHKQFLKQQEKKKKVTTCKTSSQHSRETSQQKRCRPGERDDVFKYRKKIKLSRKNIVSRKSTLQKWKRYWKHTKEITKQSWKCSSPENLLYKKCCRNFIRHK